MFEQQIRAELEAEAWRRLRQQLAEAPSALAPPQPAPPAAPRSEPAVDAHKSGSAILKGLVRFALAAFGAYLTFIAGADSQLGEFEIWLATGTAFIVVLALSAFSPLRGMVHAMAETTRWVLIVGFIVGLVWVFTHMSA
jgi:hypothetical protein